MSILILKLIGLLCILIIFMLLILNFEVEHIPKEMKALINSKNIETNVFRVQAFDSIMWGYFCIESIDFMLKGKTLTEYRYLFSPNNSKKNDDIILNYFMSNI